MLDRIARVVLLALNMFLGVTAIFGAVSVVPALPPEWLAGTPFPDFTIPAVALGLVGIGALVAAVLLVSQPKMGALLSIAVGAAIAVFEIVETAVIGLDVWLHALGLGPGPRVLTGAAEVGTLLDIPTPLWLQPFYVIVGLLIVALALRLDAKAAEPSPDADKPDGPGVSAPA